VGFCPDARPNAGVSAESTRRCCLGSTGCAGAAGEQGGRGHAALVQQALRAVLAGLDRHEERETALLLESAAGEGGAPDC
jgi:hypothetical protein